MMECSKEDSACAKAEAEKVEAAPMEQDLQPKALSEVSKDQMLKDDEDDYGSDKRRFGGYYAKEWTVKRVGFKEYTCQKKGSNKVFTVEVGFGKYVALDEDGREKHYGDYPSKSTGLLSNWIVDGKLVAEIEWSTRCDEDHMTVYRGGAKWTVMAAVQEYISEELGHEYYAHSNTHTFEGKRSRSDEDE